MNSDESYAGIQQELITL